MKSISTAQTQSFSLTQKQREANTLLASDATDILLEGGSRSGKTFLIVRAICTRAIKEPESRHGIFRLRFNHIKSSIIYDTLPKVMDLCYPDISPHCKLDKSDWFYKFPNDSEIWFGGLDDKERTEKILGQEYATLFFNEVSQVPYSSIEMALTRLAQNTGLKLKAYYDANPPTTAHWTYLLFHKLIDPVTKQPLANPENYARLLMNPRDNIINLSEAYIKRLEGLSPQKRRRFLEGQYSDATEGALWDVVTIEQSRTFDQIDMQRVVVAVDPSGCSGEDDSRSDEIGIVVVGLGVDGKVYILEDLSGKYGPKGWAQIACTAYYRHKADRLVAEVNYGGEMVKSTIKAYDDSVPVTKITATRGKVVRAEPISVLTSEGKVRFAGNFPELEDQCCAMTTNGYIGDKSPDRLDAMVWGVSYLFPGAEADDDDEEDEPHYRRAGGWMA